VGGSEAKKKEDTPKSCAGEGINLFLSHENANRTKEQQMTKKTKILSHASRTTEDVKWPAKSVEPCTSEQTNSHPIGMTTARGTVPEHVLWCK